jgi:hypothetical protein
MDETGGADETHAGSDTTSGSSETDTSGDGDGGDGDGDADACGPLPALDPQADWDALTSGVNSIDFGGGAPSSLLVHGGGAFSVVRDIDGDTAVAAARVGMGRVIAFGHETVLGGDLPLADNEMLAANAARWTGGSDSPAIGVAPELADLASALTAAGFTVTTIGPTAAELAAVDTYATAASTDRTMTELDAIADYVESGGGLITAGQAWWWAGSNSDWPTQYPGNRLLWDAGITITDDAWAIDGPTLAVGSAPDALDNGTHAFDRLRRHVEGTEPLNSAEEQRAFDTANAALADLPVPGFDTLYCRAKAYAASFGSLVPTTAAPVQPASQPFEALALGVDAKVGTEDAPTLIVAHASASDFPGVPEAGSSASSRTLSVDASYDGRDSRYFYSGAGAHVWRSTGLYANAGDTITTTVPASAAAQGLSVQIGSHSDTLWHLDDWERVPAIVRRDSIETTSTTSANAFGGLVYIRVPPGSALGTIDVTIDGAHPAPRYVHGVTTLSDWQDIERLHPTPWAEFVSDSFTFTVPSTSIRTLDDPSALMDMWTSVLNAQADLSGVPHARPRAERFVLDRQISAGWMHSGYPIMGPIAAVDELIDASLVQSVGAWGPFHELGHNHQWREFVLPGTTEGNVNLWSVHTSETVFGIDRGVAHSALDPAARAQRIADYVAGGADFWADWSVWTALETYLQLQEAFGWQPFSDLFTVYYYTLPENAGLTDQENIEAFALEYARIVDRDLGPFFISWGFPLSQPTLDEMALMPAWAGNPMP